MVSSICEKSYLSVYSTYSFILYISLLGDFWTIKNTEGYFWCNDFGWWFTFFMFFRIARFSESWFWKEKERTQNSVISIRLMLVCSAVRSGGIKKSRSLPFRVIQTHVAKVNIFADWQFNTTQQWHNLMIEGNWP